ncbi:MAG: hypothetical protein PHY29_05165 [Syntrophales bacterium]|nr:hypothetical protein [Syntrophales bacterium]
MKKSVLLFVVLVIGVFFASLVFAGQHTARGHWRDTNRDGVKDTYIAPHVRTNPNNTITDNYSYPGNYNPNKGAYTPQSYSTQDLYPVTIPNLYGNPNDSWGD